MAKTKRRIKPAETVREKADKAKDQPDKKQGRVKRALSSSTKPIKSATKAGKKEYYLPLPDNKFSNFLNKRRHFIPSYLRNSFVELKQVVWPNRKQTAQLTLAVFGFAIVFGIIITVTDYGLDKIFKKLLIK